MSKGTLSVQGRGQASTEPDLAVISFDVKGRAWEYGEAIDDLNEKVDALRRDLERAGVARAEVRFHTDVMYDMSGPEARGSSVPNIEPSQITAEDTVTVVWDIRETG